MGVVEVKTIKTCQQGNRGERVSSFSDSASVHVERDREWRQNDKDKD